MERIKQAIERAQAERVDREPIVATSRLGVAKLYDRSVQERSVPVIEPRLIDVSWPALYERRVVGGPQASALVDTYRVLRTQVLQRLSHRNARTLGITSANPGEGKSLTAVNLAISLAMKIPVYLVDADLRRPSIRGFFDVDSSVGLAECLYRKADVESCIFCPGVENLAVLPGGAPRGNSSELLASQTMIDLVESLKRSNSAAIIVFDLPPLLTSDDTLAFAPHLEGILLVVEEGRTAPDELRRAKELIQGAELLGTVLNKSFRSSSTYHTSYY